MGVGRKRALPLYFYMQGSKIMKMLELPLKERVDLLKKLMKNDQRAWKYFYQNFADDGLVEGQSMNQFHYLMALDECEKVDGNRGNKDFNDYIYKKSYKDARNDTSGARIIV